MTEWDDFLPMADRLLRRGYIKPWCKTIMFDEKENGYWVKWDDDFKNTVIDPRDTPKPAEGEMK